jgi:hypothetical protein
MATIRIVAPHLYSSSAHLMVTWREITGREALDGREDSGTRTGSGDGEAVCYLCLDGRSDESGPRLCVSCFR